MNSFMTMKKNLLKDLKTQNLIKEIEKHIQHQEKLINYHKKKIDKIINDEIDTILKKGISKKRFEIEKKKFIFDSIYERDGVLNPAQSVGEAITIGIQLDDLESLNNKIVNVSLQDVSTALKKFSNNNNFVIGELNN